MTLPFGKPKNKEHKERLLVSPRNTYNKVRKNQHQALINHIVHGVAQQGLTGNLHARVKHTIREIITKRLNMGSNPQNTHALASMMFKWKRSVKGEQELLNSYIAKLASEQKAKLHIFDRNVYY